tara:strand:+ start:1543 stop:2499 length:957 start_codon:yes stop_codon:yes gene_type:complete
MAEQNITTEQEQQLRLVKRNSSNQIVSYTIDTDETPGLEYGYKKVPAVFTNYEESVYNRTIDGLSNELIVNIPEVPLEIVQQNFIDEANLYKVQGRRLVTINGTDVEETDEFSARYEISKTINKAGIDNAGGDGYLALGNHWWKQNTVLPLTEVVYGKPQSEPGRYVITPELIESGNDLKVKFRGYFKHNTGTNAGFEVKLQCNRIGGRSVRVRNPIYHLNYEMQPGQYVTIEKEATIPNANMVAYDTYEILARKTTTTSEMLIFASGTKWEITTERDGQAAIVWPPTEGNPTSYTDAVPDSQQAKASGGGESSDARG